MMKKLIGVVRNSIRMELSMANENHPNEFNSYHEAYAVIKEELEEALDEIDGLETDLENMWEAIKHDEDANEWTQPIYRKAMLGACELIQVAAMALKAHRTPCDASDEEEGKDVCLNATDS